MNMENLKKVSLGFLAAVMLFGGTPISSNAMSQRDTNYNNSADEFDVVIVEVVINQLDTGYIENIILDDGTRVGDHDFVIIETPAERNSRNLLTGAGAGTIAVAELRRNFNFVGWITRNGVVSISLDPVSAARSNRTRNNTAWDALRNPLAGVSSDSRWRNEASLRAQYVCHFDFASIKNRWNLEPHRTTTNWFWTTVSGCNPR